MKKRLTENIDTGFAPECLAASSAVLIRVFNTWGWGFTDSEAIILIMLLSIITFSIITYNFRLIHRN